jgi:hypothetical protein
LLGKVFAVVLVNATVPEPAVKWMLPDVLVTFPAMVKVRANMLNTPEFKAKVPVEPTVTVAVLVIVNVPDEWVYVPLIANVPVETVTDPALCVKVEPDINVNVLFTMARVPAVMEMEPSTVVFAAKVNVPPVIERIPFTASTPAVLHVRPVVEIVKLLTVSFNPLVVVVLDVFKNE